MPDFSYGAYSGSGGYYTSSSSGMSTGPQQTTKKAWEEAQAKATSEAAARAVAAKQAYTAVQSIISKREAAFVAPAWESAAKESSKQSAISKQASIVNVLRSMTTTTKAKREVDLAKAGVKGTAKTVLDALGPVGKGIQAVLGFGEQVGIALTPTAQQAAAIAASKVNSTSIAAGMSESAPVNFNPTSYAPQTLASQLKAATAPPAIASKAAEPLTSPDDSEGVTSDPDFFQAGILSGPVVPVVLFVAAASLVAYLSFGRGR